MRNMSFSLTTPQIRAGTKTVTRRIGWWNVEPGELLMAIEKGQGLKKGEHVTRIRPIRVVSAKAEKLCKMKRADLAREGFTFRFKWDFIRMFCKHNNCDPLTIVNRIEFEYIRLCTCCGGKGKGEFGERPTRMTCPKCLGSGVDPEIEL